MDIVLIVVLLILLGFALHGYLRGLVRVLFSLAAVFVAIGFATALEPYTAQFLKTQTPLYDTVKDNCTEYLQSILEKEIQNEVEEREEVPILGMELPEEIQHLFGEDAADQAGSLIENTGIYEKAGDFVAGQVVHRLAWMLAFTAILILLVVAVHFLDVLAKLPVLRNINRIGGLAVGLLEGLIVVWILLLVIVLCQGTEFGRELMSSVQTNAFLKFLNDNNVLEQLILR